MKLKSLRYLIVALVCLLPLYSYGVTIEVETEGTLEQVIDNSEELSFKELKIIGRLNAVDIKYLRSSTGRIATVESLDLSEVTIVGGGGAYASVGYSNNEVTMDTYKVTFYSSEENRKDTTITSNMLGGNTFDIKVYCNNMSGAFADMKYNRVVMPQNVNEIGIMTFYRCEKLTTVEMTQNLEIIGDRAFEGCTALLDLDLSHVKEMGQGVFYNCGAFRGNEESTVNLSSLNSVPDFAFFRNSMIQHLQFSTNLKAIGENAFQYCEKLEEANMPEGLKHIGNNAFSDCSALSTVNIPSTVENINYDMFYNTPWIASQTADDGILYINNVALKYVGSNSSNLELTIREGTTAIGDRFSSYIYKEYFKSITFPSTLLSIGEEAFSGCSSLTTLTFPDKLEKIGKEAFYNCGGIETLDLSSTSLTEIGEKAFGGCSGLTTLILPSELKVIGEYAFSECTNLAELNLPSSLEVLNGGAFYGCI